MTVARPRDAVQPFGDRAVTVALLDPSARAGVVAQLSSALPGMVVRAGMECVLVEADAPDPELLETVQRALAEAREVTVRRERARHLTIPVAYDGPDVRAAALALGCTADDVVASHCAQRWNVAIMGFAPGFGYLEPSGTWLLPWSAVSRLDRPREQVPAGSVAIAAGMSAVYPAAMPGGWLLIGRTDAVVFDAADVDDPTLLHPGDVVQFAEVDR